MFHSGFAPKVPLESKVEGLNQKCHLNQKCLLNQKCHLNQKLPVDATFGSDAPPGDSLGGGSGILLHLLLIQEALLVQV